MGIDAQGAIEAGEKYRKRLQALSDGDAEGRAAEISR
jgi:hypothetical protein